MDVCYLNKDVIGVVFTQLPQIYSVFVRLCREMKRFMKSINLDGWDALVAQGCSVKIKPKCIKWYKNGKKHRVGAPAVMSSVSLEWWENGELHREDGPAQIYRGGTENLWYDVYFKHGEKHRIDGPAVVGPKNHVAYYINGVRHRDDGPAIVLYEVYALYMRNGKIHNDDGPAYISKGDYSLRWYRNNIPVDNEYGVHGYCNGIYRWITARVDDSYTRYQAADHPSINIWYGAVHGYTLGSVSELPCEYIRIFNIVYSEYPDEHFVSGDISELSD